MGAGWSAKDIGNALAVVGLGVVFAVSLLVSDHPTTPPTVQQEVLSAIGAGSYWQKGCGANCLVAVTSSGAQVGIETNGVQVEMALEPTQSVLDKRLLTSLAGRSAWIWVGQVQKLFGEGGAGVPYIADFNQTQLTFEFNTTVGLPVIIIQG